MPSSFLYDDYLRYRSLGDLKCNPIDIVGKRFGQLQVLSYSGCKEKNGKLRHYYFVQCDCGTKKFIMRDNLKWGSKSRSCGCSRRGKRYANQSKT